MNLGTGSNSCARIRARQLLRVFLDWIRAERDSWVKGSVEKPWLQ